MELDELIGEVRREAARRRAAPDFPLDREASLSAALDALGPVGVGQSGADLAAIVARLRALGGADRPVPDPATAPEPSADPAPDQPSPADPLVEVAALTAMAVNALAARLDHLQRRVGRSPVAAAAGDSGPAPDPGRQDEVIDALLASSGSVLVIGPGASQWVRALSDAGIAASAVDPHLAEFADVGSVRAGSVAEHLASIGDQALSGVLVTGAMAAAFAPRLYELCEDLGRITRLVVVISEAPWAWRLRLGEAAADVAPERPLSPEAWLYGLSGVGFSTTGSYGPDGKDYVLVATVPGAALD